jgi:hypothetical protein
LEWQVSRARSSTFLRPAGDEARDVIGGLDVGVRGDEDLAGGGVDDVVQGAAADEVGVEVVGAGQEEVVGHALVGPAVLLADDDVLRDVDEAAREVSGVGGVGGRVDQALAGAVGRDEVLERLEALAEVGLDGQVDRVAGHVGHEAAHACELTELRL